MKEIRPDHVAIYIRWSTEDQGDGTTLAVQSEACRHYVISQGWEVRDELIFIDDGYSGGSLERPAMTRLRKAVQDGLVDCVVVFRLDRLSRSVIDTVTLVLQEWADLTHLKSAREPVDTTSAMGKQFFYMLVSYAEWERSVIRERMFSGKLRRAREGRNPGMPAAYGYRKGPAPGTLVANEAEAAVVRLIFQLAEQGISVRQIARHLNRYGHPTRKGGPWGPGVVARVLRNPLYTGKLVWGRRRVNPRFGKAPGERKYREAEPHAVTDTTSIPALIHPDQFDRVQVALAGRSGLAPGAAGSEHLLTGVLRCAACGSVMQHNGYRRWRYYRCGGKVTHGGCSAPSIPAAPLEAAVVDAVLAQYGTKALHAAEAMGATVIQQRQERLAADLAAARAAIVRLEGQAQRIDEDYRRGALTAAERREMLAAVQAERTQLQATGEQLSARETDQLATAMCKDDPWSTLPPAEQKALLRAFVAEVRALRAGPAEIRAELKWG